MDRPPQVQATSVSISTPAPRDLAAFYARLLGVGLSASEGPRPGEPPDAGWAQLRPAEGRLAMTLNFEWDEHYAAPVWPTPETPGSQVMAHLDLRVDDLVAAVAWAVECGATVHAHQPQQSVRVMVDPHGHPFCLFVG
ncbi:VOC family protein [Ornithinimicrobium cavernae]|uniref:VOC family protein n=1 Tax=Ornithinimicrobium cavernae TaxID=2666047 RepID=UPI000D68E824|nr:VOC family protein [Ornithinimicrobium cavernae]